MELCDNAGNVRPAYRTASRTGSGQSSPAMARRSRSFASRLVTRVGGSSKGSGIRWRLPRNRFDAHCVAVVTKHSEVLLFGFSMNSTKDASGGQGLIHNPCSCNTQQHSIARPWGLRCGPGPTCASRPTGPPRSWGKWGKLSARSTDGLTGVGRSRVCRHSCDGSQCG